MHLFMLLVNYSSRPCKTFRLKETKMTNLTPKGWGITDLVVEQRL